MVTEHNANTVTSYNSNHSVPVYQQNNNNHHHNHSKSNGTQLGTVHLHGVSSTQASAINFDNNNNNNNTNHNNYNPNHHHSTLVQIEADTVSKNSIFTVAANMGHQSATTAATNTTKHKSHFFKNPLKGILKNNGAANSAASNTNNVFAGESLPFTRAKVGILKQSSVSNFNNHHPNVVPSQHLANFSERTNLSPLTEENESGGKPEANTEAAVVQQSPPPTTTSAKSQITIPIQFKLDYPKANNADSTTIALSAITDPSNEQSNSLANSSNKLPSTGAAATSAGSIIARSKFGVRNELVPGTITATTSATSAATANSIAITTSAASSAAASNNSLQPLSANHLQVPTTQPTVIKAITARNKFLSPSAAQSQLSSLTSPSGVSNQNHPAYYLGASSARISDLRKILNPEVEKEDSFKKLSETIENCDCFEFNLNNAAKLITVLVLLATLILVIKALKGDS